MKHAGPDALGTLGSLLTTLREFSELKERKPGTFYLKSSAYLHFHEDPLGMFADVKLEGSDFVRIRVSTQSEQRKLIALVRANLKQRA